MIYAHSSKEKNAFCALSPFFFVSFRKDKRTRLRLLLLLLQQLSSRENERKKERKEGRKEEDVSKKRHKKCRFFREIKMSLFFAKLNKTLNNR